MTEKVNNDIEIFKKYNSSTPEFSLNGYKTLGRVVNIYDGDTIKIVVPLFGSYYKINVRLNDIDCCEIKSKDELLKQTAIKTRNRLCEIITGKKVNTKEEIDNILNDNVYLLWIECLKSDKYGRILSNLYIKKGDTKRLSDILIDEKLAYTYKGKTKLTDEEIKNILNIV